jgi:hypothetical protein
VANWVAETLKIDWAEVNMFFYKSVGKDQKDYDRDTMCIDGERADADVLQWPQETNKSTPFCNYKDAGEK